MKLTVLFVAVRVYGVRDLQFCDGFSYLLAVLDWHTEVDEEIEGETDEEELICRRVAVE